MKQLFISTIPLLFLTLFGINALLVTPIAYADTDICNNSQVPKDVRAASGCDGEVNELPDSIENIVSAVIVVAGIVAVIFIIVGGVQYMTSSGDPSKTKKAKDTILYACIGLVICALAFAIVNFVISDILKQN